MTLICHNKLLTAGLRIMALRRLGKCHFSSSRSRHARLICQPSISAPLTGPFICRCQYSSSLTGTSSADKFELPDPIERDRQNWMRLLREEQRAREQRAKDGPWLSGFKFECKKLMDWKEEKTMMALSVVVGGSIETTALNSLKPPESIELCPFGTSEKSSSIFGKVKQITSHNLLVILENDNGRNCEGVRFKIRRTGNVPMALEILENGEEWHKMPGFPAMLWAYGCDSGEWPKAKKPDTDGLESHSLNMEEMIMRLDEDQRNALAAALDPNRPIVAVHGPPGTGKSMLAMKYIRAEVQSGKRVMVVCGSNSPMYSLMGHYLHRTGSDPQHHENILLLLAPYESQIADQLISDPKIKKAIESRTLRHLIEEQGFRGNYTTEHVDARNRIIRDCPLQFCTPGKAILSLIAKAKTHFDVMVMEQANLLNVTDSWAIILSLAPRVRLFGDSRQLTRPVLSEIAREQNFDQSLLQCLEEKDDQFCQGQQVNFHLRIQYRSNPAIHHWSNTVIYPSCHNSEPDSSVANLGLAQLLSGESNSKQRENLITEPMVLIDTSLVGKNGGEGGEGWAEWMFETKGRFSFFNEGVALLVASYLCRLHNSGFRPSQIAVFHNYAAQQNQIMQLLSILSQNGQQQFSPTQIHQPVDFLGQYFDIVLDNPVKDAREIYKGLRELQFLNHKITRARRQFVLVANSKHLRESPMSKELDDLIRTFEQKGRIMAPGELMPLHPGEFEKIMREKNDQLRRERDEMRKRVEEMKIKEENRWKEAEMEEIEERRKMRQAEEDEERKIIAKRNQQTIEQLKMKLMERGQTIKKLEEKLRDQNKEMKFTEKEQIIDNLGKKLRDKNETMRNFEAELRDMETMVEGIGQHTTKLEMKLQHARKMAKKRGQMIKKLLKRRLRNRKNK